ncbi:MAG: WYL domain-containing protein [Acidimicrobiia bacterium]|jgi:proteasome accessory factor C|nr:MAG: WYL domain-containing protein [Acidimicrobiia bacterium]
MSEKTARRLTRILTMLPWVIAHPGATVDEVCSRFGYTRRQLVEDLDLVFVCGLPGYGPGELMVAYVDDDEVVVDMADYFSQPLRLGPEEALTLLASGLTLQSAGGGTPPLAAALDKLIGALAGDDADVLAVTVSADSQLLASLRAAVESHTVLTLTYTSLGKGETTERDVEPWQVVSSRGQWYLDAWCRRSRAERRFRVDRIRSAVAKEETFDPPAALPDAATAYVPADDDVIATLRLQPSAGWVADYYDVHVLEATDEQVVVEMAAPSASVIARLLLRLGPDAELVAGDEVASVLSGLRSAVLARYE